MKTEELLAKDAERKLQTHVNDDRNFEYIDSFENFVSEVDGGVLYILMVTLESYNDQRYKSQFLMDKHAAMLKDTRKEYQERYNAS